MGAPDPGAPDPGAPDPAAVQWIAVDWGTSNLRLWAVDGAGAVLARRQAERGMGALTPEAFEPALVDLAGDLLAPGRVTPVLICGMAGARQGWAEAPYRAVPCAPSAAGAIAAPVRDPRLAVHILPGLCQADPPDVMRGEETQIAGFLAERPGFTGTLCLPGTHGKWVRVASGEIRGFRTAMTGEIFALLARHSVLRHSLDDGWDETAFDEGVACGHSQPDQVLADLFTLRAAGLLGAQAAAPGAGRARLSGLLIGAELAAMRRFWADGPLVLIGARALCQRYATALGWLGARAEIAAAEGLTLAGLAAARAQLQEEQGA